MTKGSVFSASPVKASSLIGASVFNNEGERLGDIKEVVLDPRSGKVAYVVVTFGGFLGLGEKMFAIPFSAFEFNLLNDQYILDVSKEFMKDAPGFDSDHWPSLSDEKWNRDVYGFYGRSPFWE